MSLLSLRPCLRTSRLSRQGNPSLTFSRSILHSPLEPFQGCPTTAAILESSLTIPLEGDIVIAKQERDPTRAYLSKPLRRGDRLSTHRGDMKHDDIIGRLPRDAVRTNTDQLYRLHHPSLEEYVTRVKRLVTPIYPQDAAMIVNQLDIHVGPRREGDTTPIVEIFESGTGHGSLTLQLCRAIHAANAPGKPRGAVIHTVEINEAHSRRAKEVVEGFRRGMYVGDAEFYVSNPDDWIAEQFSKRGSEEPFLAGGVLDLPDVHNYLRSVASALRVDAPLGVFCPSITQIAKCVQVAKENRISLFLDRCIEFGNGSAAGREWDVRLATVRASVKKAGSEAAADSGVESASESEAVDAGTRFEMVCRPTVGKMTVGGGFFGLFRKMDVKRRVD